MTETPTLTRITERLAEVESKASALREQRLDITSRLENLAHVWADRYPQGYVKGRPTFHDRLGCSRCTFRYVGVYDDEVVFGTDCTYCGRDSGAGVKIKVTWFERQLQGQGG